MSFIRPKYLALLLVFFILVLVYLGLASCATETNFKVFHAKHDTTAAKYCGVWYPVESKTIVTTKYKEGIPYAVHDTSTVYKNCDSAYIAGYDEALSQFDKKKKNHKFPVFVPPATPISRVDTFFKDIAVLQKSTADSVIAAGRYATLYDQYQKQASLTATTDVEKRKWKAYAMREGYGYLAVILASSALFYVKMRRSYENKAKLVT